MITEKLAGSSAVVGELLTMKQQNVYVISCAGPISGNVLELTI